MNRSGLILTFVILVGVLVWAFSNLGEGLDTATDYDRTETLRGPVDVLRVVDGDTIDITDKGRTDTVRLIGVDTPEFDWESMDHECFAKESAEGLRDLIGTSVWLGGDQTQDGRDSYGRLLAYVVTAAGSNINEQMIREGFAYEYTFRDPYRLRNDFVAAEKEAKENNVGLWKFCR